MQKYVSSIPLLKIQDQLTFYSLVALSLFIFTSISLSAISHILILLPGIYYCYQRYKDQSFSLPQDSFFLIIFLFFAFLSIFVNWNLFASPVKAIFSLKYFVLGFLALFAYRYALKNISEKKVRFLIYGFLLSATVATVSGTIAYYTGFNPVKWKDACHPIKACGLYGMAITYGYNISLFSSLLLTFILFYKKLGLHSNKLILWAVFAINIFGLYISFARGGVVAFIASLFVIFYFQSKKLFYISLVLLLGLITVLLIKLNTAGTYKNPYLLHLRAQSNMIRLGQYQGAIHSILDKPLFGLGFRNFEDHSIAIKNKFNVKHFPNWRGHAHSNFLEIFSGVGIIGGIFFTLWCLFWFISCLKGTLYQKMFAPFVANFLVSGLFQSTIIDGENMFFIMAIYALSHLNPKKLQAV